MDEDHRPGDPRYMTPLEKIAYLMCRYCGAPLAWAGGDRPIRGQMLWHEVGRPAFRCPKAPDGFDHRPTMESCIECGRGPLVKTDFGWCIEYEDARGKARADWYCRAHNIERRHVSADDPLCANCGEPKYLLHDKVTGACKRNASWSAWLPPPPKDVEVDEAIESITEAITNQQRQE